MVQCVKEIVCIDEAYVTKTCFREQHTAELSANKTEVSLFQGRTFVFS